MRKNELSQLFWDPKRRLNATECAPTLANSQLYTTTSTHNMLFYYFFVFYIILFFFLFYFLLLLSQLTHFCSFSYDLYTHTKVEYNSKCWWSFFFSGTSTCNNKCGCCFCCVVVKGCERRKIMYRYGATRR